MAANLKELAKLLKTEGLSKSKPFWVRTAETLDMMAETLPLPYEVGGGTCS